jgi:hypothetical protein
VFVLQPRTCANYNPIANPGEQFDCPADTEFDHKAGNKTNPDVQTCCRVRSNMDCQQFIYSSAQLQPGKFSEQAALDFPQSNSSSSSSSSTYGRHPCRQCAHALLLTIPRCFAIPCAAACNLRQRLTREEARPEVCLPWVQRI